jgi:tripartite-type tricarboxylate transporter receptor subunit TctC
MLMLRWRTIWLAALVGLAGTCGAWAQTGTAFPDRPVRLVLAFGPGGLADVTFRLVAEKLTGLLGKQVLVENAPGAGGVAAAQNVLRAKPDGHTLLAGTTTELVIAPVITAHPPYDPVKDLAPITITAVSVSSLMVHESVPAKTLQEFVAYAKASPGKLSYGSAGVGTSAHLCAELFKQLAGLPDIVHVPYRGANPGLADFYAGRLPMFAASISPQVLEMHRQGKIRILVAGTNRRLEGAPEIPTNVEAGFPDLVTLMFMGLFAPAGTPRSVIDQIAAATRQVMGDKEFQQKLITAGFEPVTDSGPEQTAKFVAEELVRWTPILKAAGIQPN